MSRFCTPDRANDDGSTTMTMQRCCDGCGQPIGDVTDAEVGYAVAGRPLPSVVAEHGCTALGEGGAR